MARHRKPAAGLNLVHRHCAGIDLGSREHWVAADAADPKPFGCLTRDLAAMAAWLRERAVTVVAMEATGVYWIPVFEFLDREGFEVHLVDSRALASTQRRKSDVLDCVWLWRLMSYGLLRSAFRPHDDICELRAYVRQHRRLVEERSRTVLHMRKALTQMNVQLGNVISDLAGKTGMAILNAIAAGERDGRRLAALRDRRVKASEDTIAASLEGNWRDEHLFALRQALESWEHFNRQIADCKAAIGARAHKLATGEVLDDAVSVGTGEAQMHDSVCALLGVDLTTIPGIGLDTALCIASEIGPDLSRFPDSRHFCSWLHLAPSTNISGGRKLPGRGHAPKCNRVGLALQRAAVNLRHDKSLLGERHRRRLQRLDKQTAIKASAHQLARIIYAMLTQRSAYHEQCDDERHLARRLNQERNLRRRARELGFEVTKKVA